MNKDTVAGAVKETGGKIRSKVDKAIGNKKGESLGRKDQAMGNLQKNYGKLKDSIKNS